MNVPVSGRSDIEIGYDGGDHQGRPNKLHGRKAYHHFTEREHTTTSLKSDQNRTVIDPEGEGATFTFEDLPRIELGLTSSDNGLQLMDKEGVVH